MLRPCPFCGGAADLAQVGDRRRSAIVACTMCGAWIESDDEGDRSADAWNRRPGEETLLVACRRALDVFGRETMGPDLTDDQAERFDAILHLTHAVAAAEGREAADADR